MKSKLVAANAGERTYVLVLESRRGSIKTIGTFAPEEPLSAASLTAPGAFSRAMVGWFDLDAKTYRKIPVTQQCEVLSAVGRRSKWRLWGHRRICASRGPSLAWY